jgi:hypothetical protein
VSLNILGERKVAGRTTLFRSGSKGLPIGAYRTLAPGKIEFGTPGAWKRARPVWVLLVVALG